MLLLARIENLLKINVNIKINRRYRAPMGSFIIEKAEPMNELFVISTFPFISTYWSSYDHRHNCFCRRSTDKGK